MKKLLVLVLVLGLASVASATLQISVNGNPDPVDSMIILDPAGIAAPSTVVLDIWTDTGLPLNSALDYVLICDSSLGSITGGVKVTPPQGMAWVAGVVPDAAGNYYNIPEGYQGVGFASVANPNAIPVNQKIFDEILFTCLLAPNDVTIVLGIVNGDGEYTGENYDSIVIHQIPEPATIALLGLGGLLLRRRK